MVYMRTNHVSVVFKTSIRLDFQHHGFITSWACLQMVLKTIFGFQKAMISFCVI